MISRVVIRILSASPYPCARTLQLVTRMNSSMCLGKGAAPDSMRRMRPPSPSFICNINDKRILNIYQWSKNKETWELQIFYVLCWRLFCQKMAMLHAVWIRSLSCQVCWWQLDGLIMFKLKTWKGLKIRCLFNLVEILTSCKHILKKRLNNRCLFNVVENTY